MPSCPRLRRRCSFPRPARLARGGTANIGIRVDSSAAAHIFHLDVIDLSGKAVSHYSGDLAAPQGRGEAILPLAQNDPAGHWQLRVHDVLTGQSRVAEIEVY